MGWGQVKPPTIFNGGVPSGLVRYVRWRSWGQDVAYGRGSGSQYRPGGGYYSKPVRVQFQATRLGRCSGNDRTAYTRLRARIQEKPGGRFGDWFNWDLDLCDAAAEPSACAVETPETPVTLELRAWDTDCGSALVVSEKVGWSAGRPAFHDGYSSYRRVAGGFVCNGFSLDEDRTIDWTCNRWAAELRFTTTIWW